METFQLADVKSGINFYDEVSRFEIALIERALQETGGQQRRAARLLGLKATTLNAKIKQYNIVCARRRRSAPRNALAAGVPTATAHCL